MFYNIMLSNYLGFNYQSAKIAKSLYLGNVLPSSYSLLLRAILEDYAGLLLVLVDNFNTAYQLADELKSNITREKIDILHFPDWETLPYDNFSPHVDIISERLTTLYKLSHLAVNKSILIVPMATIMHRVCPKEYIQQNVFIIENNTELVLEDFTFKLQQSGYTRVSQVCDIGEFVVRGAIIDIFPIGADLPYRIELFDNQICSIRTFSVESQRTIAKVSNINILPSREYPITEEAIANFKNNWFEYFNSHCPSSLLRDLKLGSKVPGVEYYLPLFFDSTNSLLDYLPNNSLIIRAKECLDAADLFSQQVKVRFEQLAYDTNRFLLPINKLFFNTTEVFSLIKNNDKNFKQIICSKEASKDNLNISCLPEIDHNKLPDFKILFCVESKSRKEIIKKSIPCDVKDISNIEQLLEQDVNYGIIVSKIQHGFILNSINVAIICEEDLFPNKVKQFVRKKERSKTVDLDYSIKNLIEINIDDPIVHVEHGIGRYKGLTQLDYGTTNTEFMVIEYAEQNKLYIPITNLNLVHKYSGVNLEHAPLNKLGTDKWQKEKNKAAKQIKDIAVQLLEIYAMRANRNRSSYVLDNNNYQKFTNNFLFTETKDQSKAINDVINDLANHKPMDRVICGDVGFGKTEIAMRAAFLVADQGKQVAILVPTTLLAEQHYQTFLDRFIDFPIQVELLSRFVTKAKQQEVIKKIESGVCDIIIGTHRLLQQDLKFKNLGLLIIDEEHKFGVEQKEKFKKLRSEVDLLSLTATPIPRTLNMAMSGIRDISIIATPPSHRLAVKTFVREYNIDIVKEAIERELQRGGQIYYLHNKVTTIYAVKDKLQNIFPNIVIKIAHGQMPERELERIMADFYHKRFEILICTTIIENGIDIANVNTIIIDRADCFGLSQLHQLRGRVGRSHHQAYAFCFTPPLSSLNQDAIKRLEALENLDTLGSGFTLATHDLEIRGSGELLGSEQSGNMHTIGFSLYMELLEHAVNLLKQDNNLDNLDNLSNLDYIKNIEIDLHIPVFIPESYIPDVHTRLILYKKINKAKTEHKLQELHYEFIDRFGSLPQELANLLAVSNLKLICLNLGIIKIKYASNGYNIEFAENNKINIDKIVQLLQKNPKEYKMITNNKLRCIAEIEANQKRIDYIRNIINLLY